MRMWFLLLSVLVRGMGWRVPAAGKGVHTFRTGPHRRQGRLFVIPDTRRDVPGLLADSTVILSSRDATLGRENSETTAAAKPTTLGALGTYIREAPRFSAAPTPSTPEPCPPPAEIFSRRAPLRPPRP